MLRNPVSINAATILCLFSCDERSEEHDWHAVERPVRFELRGDFGAVLLRHDQIDKHEIGFETARAFQCAARIDDRARDIFSGSIEKPRAPRANRELLSTIRIRGFSLDSLAICSFRSLILI